MNGKNILEELGTLDEAVIEKNARAPQKKRTGILISLIAACLAAVLCLGLLIPGRLTENAPTVNALKDPTKILGPSRLGKLGSLDALGASSAPPRFAMHFYSNVITARVLESLPDTYYLPELQLASDPVPYRLLRLKVLDVVAGKGLPEELWYLLPEHLFVDMTCYDTLLISLWQAGTDGMTLENSTAGRMENYELLFYSGEHPELGDIIAFSDGIFDESLWQEESWSYGYQFGKFYLDYPERSYGNMAVRRGSTLEQAIEEIRTRIREHESYQEPCVEVLHFQTEEARQALDYVRDPENGVYVQVENGNGVLFYRYAGGIRTNEYIGVNRMTGEVRRSDAVFTPEELSAMPDVPGYLTQLQALEETPVPPHMDPAGKNLWSYGAYGQYVKTATGVYGIVTQVWIYWEKGESWNTGYYDMCYTLLDTESNGAKQLSAGELNELLGQELFYDEGCGTGYPLPQ